MRDRVGKGGKMMIQITGQHRLHTGITGQNKAPQ